MSEGVIFSDAARETDRTLAEIDAQIDWLTWLTPTNLDEVEAGFRESGWRTMPELLYPDLPDDFGTLRDRLLSLKVRALENTDIEALVLEKQRELDRQIQLVRLRGRSGFTMAAIDMFGNVDASLLEAAQKVLSTVPDQDRVKAPRVDAKQFMRAAEKEMALYRERDERFDFKVVEEKTPGTHLFTSAGNLHVAFDYRCPETRVYPLIQHEIGVHSVTRFNGSQQPLAMLEGGLADYDDLQEGLAVLAEYLCGDMPPSRLRVLAARVVAARMAIDGHSAADIFAAMYEEHKLEEDSAFDTTVRALRGGGMTKDALYLDGLIDVLAYLRAGGDIDFLFIGKFAFKQRAVLKHLLDAGFLKPPALMPEIFTGPDGRQRIADLRRLKVEQLYRESISA
ncbi:MAG: tyrosine/phenylalanine carboxypeptidase domain-containing protein [Erythrobacter sp.]